MSAKKEVQVICTRAIWFETTQINGVDAQTRHSAGYGDVVEIPSSEAERLEELGAVQDPGGVLPRDRGPVATPFSQPQGASAFTGPVMGDPKPGGDESNLGVGGLTPEQLEELERKANGDDDDSLTDEELVSERRYDEAGVEALRAEAEARDILEEIEGSGANGNVVKKDLVDALKADDGE